MSATWQLEDLMAHILRLKIRVPNTSSLWAHCNSETRFLHLRTLLLAPPQHSHMWIINLLLRSCLCHRSLLRLSFCSDENRIAVHANEFLCVLPISDLNRVVMPLFGQQQGRTPTQISSTNMLLTLLNGKKSTSFLFSVMGNLNVQPEITHV
jgi:hypothetical protein